MIDTSRPYTATAASGEVPTPGPARPGARVPAHPHMSLEELRRHWHADVDLWHHEVRVLRTRLRIAAGIIALAVLAAAAVIWFSGPRHHVTPTLPGPAADAHTEGARR